MTDIIDIIGGGYKTNGYLQNGSIYASCVLPGKDSSLHIWVSSDKYIHASYVGHDKIK